MKKKAFQQDAYRPLANRMFWPPDVSTGWGGGFLKWTSLNWLSSDGHQMSLAGDRVMGIPSLMMSRGGARAIGDPMSNVWSWRRGLGPLKPLQWLFNASWLMVPREPPMNRQTDMRENITFHKLHCGWLTVADLREPPGYAPYGPKFSQFHAFFLETFTKSYVSTLLEGRRPRL